MGNIKLNYVKKTSIDFTAKSLESLEQIKELYPEEAYISNSMVINYLLENFCFAKEIRLSLGIHCLNLSDEYVKEIGRKESFWQEEARQNARKLQEIAKLLLGDETTYIRKMIHKL